MPVDCVCARFPRCFLLFFFSFFFCLYRCSGSSIVHYPFPMGYGEISNQTIIAKYCRYHFQTSWPNWCWFKNQVGRLQQSQGQSSKFGEKTNVSVSLFTLSIFLLFDLCVSLEMGSFRVCHWICKIMWNFNLSISLHVASSGSLLTRNLADLVKKEHFILDSEYLTTLLVIVPK